MNLQQILQKHQHQFHPVFLPDLTPENTSWLDLSVDNPEMKKLNFKDVSELNDYVFGKIDQNHKVYGYGGYLEDREVYRRSNLFNLSPGNSRSFHLGIDVWTEAGKDVYAPLDALVHSFNFNNQYGDYGPTIILEHKLDNTSFYSLYGHLSFDSLEDLYKGMPVSQGDAFCQVGNFPINGDWPPHLHFQLIADMKSMEGDFPGVCSKDEKEEYKSICPDPKLFFSL